MTDDPRVDAALLRTVCSDILRELGVPGPDAEFVADALVETDLRGIASHGVTRMVPYADALKRGSFDPAARPTVERRHGAVARIDAHGGLGHLAARDAMDLAIELAEDHGVGIVSVRNSNHFGAAFVYPLRAARRDHIGFITTNGPPVMPAFGGSAPAICNNPLSWAIPTLHDPPIVLDMACMVAARGKISLAAREGRPIPEGWALDPQGRPTTDPTAALEGILLPMAGPKGYGLAVINEVLAGALAGAKTLERVPGSVITSGRYEEPMQIGHFVMALDPEAFVGTTAFKREVELVRQSLKASSSTGDVMLPGEPEYRCRLERLEQGIPLERSTLRALAELDTSGRLPTAENG